MDSYLLLRFAHFIGFILLASGLVAVFVSELRAYRTDDIRVFAEAARYTAIFYDALTLPGALIVALSGLLLAFELGLGVFDPPWFFGMWALFLFEFVEGNTVTRIQFRRTLRKSLAALESGRPLTEDVRDEARTLLGQAAHFLDIPLLLAIVYSGVVRPDTWLHLAAAVLAALLAALALGLAVPRLARPQARSAEPATKAR